MFSLGVNGAPQSHGQRTTRLPIAVIDKGLAEKAGIKQTWQVNGNALFKNGLPSSSNFWKYSKRGR